MLFSEATDELVARSYQDDRTRRDFKDKSVEADYKWLEAKLPRNELGLGSRTDDEGMWLVTASGDTEPGEAYLYVRKTHDLTLQYRVREKLPREVLASMKASDTSPRMVWKFLLI